MEVEKINGWKQIKKKEILIESIFAMIVALLIMGGVIFDLTNIVKKPIVQDLRTLSLAALQIQASLSAISIALLALIGGFISEEYQGVSISNYYLNIKPFIFKQKVLICGLLALDGINIGFHIFALYNLVIAIAWANCVFIIISVIELYEIFSGKKKIYEEIEEYVDYVLFDENIRFEKRFDMFSNYVRAWSNQVLNTVDFENCLSRYKKVISILLAQDDIKALAIINDEASNLIKQQMSILEKAKLYRAYEIFDETYLSVWSYILDKKCKGIKADFNLYEDCVEEIISLLDSIKTDDLSSKLSWRRTTDNIIRVKIYCSSNNEYPLKMPDDRFLKSVTWIVTSLGASLAERRLRGDNIRASRWGVNSTRYYFNLNIPEEIIEDYKINQCKLEFSYFYSLLKNGMDDIIMSVFEDRKRYGDYNYEEILFGMLVCAYTYYIAERESVECVPLNEKESAQKSLQKWKKDNQIQSVVYDIAWNISGNTIKRLDDDLYTILDGYERLPLNGDCKTCIINNVTNDFYLFFVAMIVGTCRREEIIEDYFTGQKAKDYYISYMGNNVEATKGKLSKILDVFSDDETSMEILYVGLEKINAIVLKNYKKYIFFESEKSFIQFEHNKNNTTLKKNAVEQLASGLAGWTYIPANRNTEIRRVLLRCTMPVEFVDEESIEYFKTNLEANLLRVIILDLLNSGRIEKYDKTKENDEQYIELLNSNQIKYIIGADYAVNMSDYRHRKNFDDYIIEKNIMRIPVGSGHTGLILEEKIGVEIVDVSLSFSHVSLADVKYEVNDENGLYKCSDLAGDLEFTKEELQEYLYKEKTVMNISVKLNYDFNKMDEGFMINRVEQK